jgi:hypothetical protein
MQNWDSWKSSKELPKLNTRVIVVPDKNTPCWVCPDGYAYLEEFCVSGKKEQGFFAYHDGSRYLLCVDKWRYEFDPDIELFKKAKWEITTQSAAATENKTTTECQLFSAFKIGLALLSQQKEVAPIFQNGTYFLSGDDWEIKIIELEE